MGTPSMGVAGQPGAAEQPIPDGFLHDWVRLHAQVDPDRLALVTPTGRWTYAQLHDRVERIAAVLHRAGVAAGSRVLVALPNSPATVAACLALHALGATSVEVSRSWGLDRLLETASAASARLVLGWARDEQIWVAAADRQPELIVWLVGSRGSRPNGSPLLDRMLFDEQAQVQGPDDAGPAPVASRLSPDHPAIVLYTSGSTGRPHGVIQTVANIRANTASIIRYLELGPDDRAALSLPLHYCYGRSVLQTHLAVGGSVVLDDRMAFPRVVVEFMRQEKATGLAGVPLTFEILKRQVDIASLMYPELRYVTQAGGAMSPETIAWARSAFAPARLFVMYGQTEATARLSYLPPEMGGRKDGSIGIPIPGVRLEVVDDSGAEVPPGTTGNLVAAGDNVTPGYLDDPEETAEILRDGWLWTGDLASRDADGYLWLQGRAKDIIKVGGHRVSPPEIEHVLEAHPAVREAAVTGAYDPLRGEVPVGFVVLGRPEAATADALLQHCRERLPAYKVPSRIILSASLPRNTSGKLLRAELRAMASGS